MDSPLSCPLCGGSQSRLFHQDNNKRSQRSYYRCVQCHLVFVPPRYYLSPEDEKAEYDKHNNDMDDAGYRCFLNRLWIQLKPCLVSGQKILEFGCGPGPLLGEMIQEDGFEVSLYDHFYCPDQNVLTDSVYDGLTSTEVIEHLHHPKQVFELWLSLIKPDGYLGIMTKLVSDQDAFANWHYKNDLTHVCFFSRECFQWLAEHYDLTVNFHGKDVIIFQRG